MVAHEGFVHDAYGQAVERVAIVEASASDERHVERAEICGADDLVVHVRTMTLVRRRIADDLERVEIVVRWTERQRRRPGDVANGWRSPDLLLDRIVELQEL